jgi:MFS family permease
VTATEREAGKPPASTRSTRSPWALAGAFAVLALVALDVAAVPAVLPSVRVELGTSSSGVVWTQDAYLLGLAVALALLVQAGALPERRVVVAGGVAAFVGGALLASSADGSATLVAGRALQGIGAAALLVAVIDRPLRVSSFSRITGGNSTGTPGAADRRTLAAVPAAAALLVLAPLVGGAVAEAADWRWLFRLEVAAAAPAALLLLVPGRKGGNRPPVRGQAALLPVGLALAVTGLIQSGPWGWGSADTLLLVAAGAALLAFAWREGLTGASAAAFAVAGCLGAALLLAPQYLELARGLSPLRSGLLTVALTLPAATLAVLAARAPGRTPGRLLVAGGLAVAALGALGLTRVDHASSYALVILSLGLLGAGAGTAAGTLARTWDAPPAEPGAGTRATAPARGPRGAAAEPIVVTAAGAALTIAAAGAVFQRAQLDERESGGSFEDALAAGVAGSAWLLAALLAAAALLAWRRASILSGSGGRSRQSLRRGPGAGDSR